MLHSLHSLNSGPRRGVILMVVLALLTLFAIVGISFVLYADSEARSAQISREAEVTNIEDINPQTLLNFALGQLITDVHGTANSTNTSPTTNDLFSAMRGQSLARNMYGYNNDAAAIGNYPYCNRVPFNGVGRLHSTNAIDDYYILNYTYYPADGAIYDPERLGTRAASGVAEITSGRPYYGANVPYTYPDINNLFLAAIRPDGTLEQPSFHRSNLTSTATPPPVFGVLGPENPLWYGNTNTSGTIPGAAHLVLRPRPFDQLLTGESWPPSRPFFPPPEDDGGDVKNRVGAPGGNDSFWMDLDYPYQVAADGRLFKPLFAFCITELDSKANLNVHGNVFNSGAHVSNQGWGPWTVNLNTVLNQSESNTNTFANLFLPSNAGFTYLSGRYGPDQKPETSGSAMPVPFGTRATAYTSPLPHFYGLVDYTGTATSPVTATGNGTLPYPSYPANYDQANAAGDLTNHPALFNTYLPSYNPTNVATASDDRNFPLANMETILRTSDTGTQSYVQSLSSDIMSILPTNLNDPVIQNLVTLRSFDVDRPGVIPYIDATTGSALQLTTTTSAAPVTYPVAAAIPLPTIGGATPTQPSEFGTGPNTADWRALTAALGKIDLNRSLPDYPAAGDWSSGTANTLYVVANQARQDFAADIFTRLTAVTMGMVPHYANPAITGDVGSWLSLDPSQITTPLTAPAPYIAATGNPNPQFAALRWLAQLSVNIVDFIDSDDIMTVFFWNPTDPVADTATGTAGYHYVVGTETPRLLINEVLVEWQVPASSPNNLGALNSSTVNVWAELYNPLKSGDTSLSEGGSARLYTQYTTPPMGQPCFSAYQILLCQKGTGDQIRGFGMAPGNALGEVPVAYTCASGSAGMLTFSPSDQPTVPPSNGGAGNTPPSEATTGYYVVGPGTPSGPGYNFVPDNITGGAKMTYSASGVTGGIHAISNPNGANPKYIWQGPPAPTVVLQRTACPYLPPTTAGYAATGQAPSAPQLATSPTFNPFVTVDYFESACWDGSNNSTTNTKMPVCLGNGIPTGSGGGSASYGTPTSDQRKEPSRAIYVNLNNYVAPPAALKAMRTCVPASGTSTFGKQNTSLNASLLWYTHLDRQLVSPMELLQVSSLPPALLTQEFGEYTGVTTTLAPLGTYDHRTPWFDDDLLANGNYKSQSHLLYRFFEFAATRARSAASAPPYTTLSANISAGTNVTITPTSMVVITPGGVGMPIRVGDVVVLDDQQSTQENVRVNLVNLSATSKAPVSFTANCSNTHNKGATVSLTTLGDRVPGKMNVNNMWYDQGFMTTGGTPAPYWSSRLFEALTDPQGGNTFKATGPNHGSFDTVDTAFNQFLANRSSYYATTATSATSTSNLPTPLVSTTDLPCQGMATGLYSSAFGVFPTGTGINPPGMFNSTFFQVQSGTPTSPVFAPPGSQPYTQYELLSKMYNNVTTRSNVFAVWVTVGYFEVLSDPVNGLQKPYKLGAEINKAENKNIRHRMFAIVDRTNLMNKISCQPTATSGFAASPIVKGIWPRGIPAAVTTASLVSGSTWQVAALSGSTTVPLPVGPSQALFWGEGWNITNAPNLVIDPGLSTEEYFAPTWSSTIPTQFTASFQNSHANGAQIAVPNTNSGTGVTTYQTLVPGNPGPLTDFNVGNFPGVVPYYNVID
jgi:hypothetical protein